MEDTEMKKNTVIAAMVAATTLFFAASCAKQETAGTQVSGEGRTFSAVIEQDITKTTITSDLKVHWQNGDRISINGFEYVATAKIPATKALFTPVDEEAPRSDKYIAFFPASIMKKDGSSWLPQTQTYVPGAFNSPMYAVSETEELSFRNLCGVLHFAVKGAEKVKAITVMAAGESVWGPFGISDDSSAVLYGGGDNTVTLDCGEEGVQLNTDNATDFYIALPAGTYSAGMEINFIGTNPEKFNVTKTTVMDITIARNTVYDLEWNFEPTVNETLAQFFKDMVKDQAALAAATDEATKANPETDPAKFFLPEIHTWENACAAIKAIDKGLDRLPNEELSDAQRIQKKGELHFFRALLYFELFRTYGKAPFVHDDYKSLLPVADIFKELINDAEMARNSLQKKYEGVDRIITLDESVEVTRPTLFAACALMARAYLYASSPLFSGIGVPVQKCIDCCMEIFYSGEYELLTEYLNLWGEKAFNNKELIFGVNFSTQSGAYNVINPTKSLQAKFEASDARLKPTFENKPVAKVLPVFRYSDIFLILAKAKLSVGEQAFALERINNIRDRAGLSAISTPTVEAIENERMKEFAFEGHRFWDVRRWGKAGKYFATIEGVQRKWDNSYNFYPVPQE